MIKKKLSFLSPATHMVTRIWLQTMGFVTAALLILALLNNLVMRESWMNRSLEELESGTSVSAFTMTENYRFTVSRFVELFSTDEFAELFGSLTEARGT